MFSNIGEKIKKLAIVVCWIGIIFSLVLGIVVVVAPNSIAHYSFNVNGNTVASSSNIAAQVITGVIVFVLGSLGSWISSFFLYGFGELVSNSKKIADSLRK
jgi:Na+-driven multidrug efflux pump